MGGISVSYLLLLGNNALNNSYPENAFKDTENIGYKLTHRIPTRLFDGEKCWVHPRAGILPAAGCNNMPRVVMTMNSLDLTGSDVFKGMFELHSDDRGELGNFGVTDVSQDETWVTVSEWMQPKGVERYGSDGSIWVARIHWKKPNELFDKN